MTQTLIVFFAAAIVFAVCVVLVFHPEYEDGVFGRLGLALLGIAAIARVLGIIGGWLDDASFRITEVGLILWIGLAIFLSRHLYRFLRWRHVGEHDWRSADHTITGGKSG